MKDRIALVNGQVYLGASQGSAPAFCEALLIRDGLVEEALSTREALDIAGQEPSWTVVDLGGRRVIPGLVDSHNHVLSAATLILGVNCFGLKSLDQLKEQVAKKAGEAEPGQWIVGAGWIESQFEERRLPSRHDLDEAAPQNPVFLSRLFGMGVANTKALEAAGIRKGSLPRRGRVDVDQDGNPTGILREGASTPIWDVIDSLFIENKDLERRILVALNELMRFGITSVVDPGVEPVEMAAYTRLWANGQLPLRVTAMPSWHGMTSPECGDDLPLIVKSGMLPGMGDSRFKIGNLKMAIDGGLGSKTALMHQPYRDFTRSTVPLRLDINRLGQDIWNAHRSGWGIGIHCCGDLAQDLAISHMVAAFQRMRPGPYHRHNIVHGYFPTEYALRAMEQHGIGVSLQPGFIYVEGDIYPQNVYETMLSKFKPVRTYLKRGIPVAINTDVASAPYDPFVALHGAVSRTTIGGLKFGEAEAITPREAVDCMTAGGAYLAYREDECGTLYKGRFADLAVLDRDILSSPNDILETRVLATMVGGRFVHVVNESGLTIPDSLR